MLTLEKDGAITYKDRVVGHHVHRSGEDVIEIALKYTASPNDWMIPLSYLALGLRKIKLPKSPVVFEVATRKRDIGKRFDVVRLLTEKEIKGDGYIWMFHKTDVDNWPSVFHGHDYENGLKIDAISGEIYDVASRQRCMCLKRKALATLHGKLRACKDTKARALRICHQSKQIDCQVCRLRKEENLGPNELEPRPDLYSSKVSLLLYHLDFHEQTYSRGVQDCDGNSTGSIDCVNPA